MQFFSSYIVCETLNKFLTETKELRKLRLCFIAIQDQNKLWNKNTSLVELSFKNVFLTDSVNLICEKIRTNKTLKKLTLNNCNLCLTLISGAMCENTLITHLDLSCNRLLYFSNFGKIKNIGSSIKEMFIKIQVLEEFIFSSNEILFFNEILQDINEGPNYNKSLVHLDISHKDYYSDLLLLLEKNSFDLANYTTIAKFFERNFTLKVLNIVHTAITLQMQIV